MALLIALGIAVLAIVAHFLWQRRAARALPPEPAPRTTEHETARPKSTLGGAYLPPANELVGRDELLDRLDELSTPPDEAAASPHARAVVLVGPPGIGKSALALAFAEETIPLESERPEDDDFRDGRVYLDLGGAARAATDDAALHLELARRVVERAAAALRDEELCSRLAGALTERRLLVILDDARDRAQVERLLRAHPGPRRAFVVITSRAPLGLDGVPELTVGGLDAESASAIFTGPPTEPALVDRRAEHDEAVVAVRERLDGNPLALELAQAILTAHLSSAPSLRDALFARLDAGLSPLAAIRELVLASLDPVQREGFTALASRPGAMRAEEAAALAGGILTLGELIDLNLVHLAGDDEQGAPLVRPGSLS